MDEERLFDLIAEIRKNAEELDEATLRTLARKYSGFQRKDIEDNAERKMRQSLSGMHKVINALDGRIGPETSEDERLNKEYDKQSAKRVRNTNRRYDTTNNRYLGNKGAGWKDKKTKIDEGLIKKAQKWVDAEDRKAKIGSYIKGRIDDAAYISAMYLDGVGKRYKGDTSHTDEPDKSPEQYYKDQDDKALKIAKAGARRANHLTTRLMNFNNKFNPKTKLYQ